MKVAGIRDLKSRLSHYLRLVGNGDVVLVTDRGAVVAQLGPAPQFVPSGGESESEALLRLARLGRTRLGTGKLPGAACGPMPAPRRLVLDKLLADVREDRG